MSRRSGRVAALQEHKKLVVLQQRLEAEDDHLFALTTLEVVTVDEVEVIDPPPSSQPTSRIQLPVKKKFELADGLAAGDKKRKRAAEAALAEHKEIDLSQDDNEEPFTEEELGEDDEEEEQEDEDEDDDEEFTVRGQRTQAAAAAKPSPRTQRAKRATAAAPVDDAVAAEVDAHVEERKDGEEERTPKSRKRSTASPRATAKRPGNAAAAAPYGKADDPIELSDGDEDAATPKKKKAKAKKKSKAVPLVERILPVPTAQPHTRKLIGAHVSSSGGVQFAPHNAALMGARVFAMDTRSKRRWVNPQYTAEQIEQWYATMQHYGYTGDQVLPHGSYLMNLGSLIDELYEKSKLCFQEELERCEQLGIRLYNFHPGRFALPEKEREEAKRVEKEKKKAARDKARERKRRVKQGELLTSEDDDSQEEHEQPVAMETMTVASFTAALPAFRQRSLHRLIDALNWAHSLESCAHVCIVLETMAGQGSSLGSSFEELRYIIDRVRNKQRIGVCVDTCHIFAADARYDMRTADTYQAMMHQLESVIGLSFIKGVHLNDSKMPLASHRDRHENIGDGEIGMDAFRLIMNDQRWNDIPIVLETPCKTEEKERIKRQKRLIKERAINPPDVDDEFDEEDDGEDDDEEDAVNEKKKQKKNKKGNKKKDVDDGASASSTKDKKKEKEDWVKSYGEEIRLVYSLEEPQSVEGKAQGTVNVQAKAEGAMSNGVG